MARLRSLYVGTETVGDVTHHKHILVLDDLTEKQGAHVGDLDRHPDVPPILTFTFPVELPEEEPDQNPSVALDVTRDDTAMKDLIRDMVRADANRPTAEF